MAERQYLNSKGVVYFAKTNYMNPDQGYKGSKPNLQITLIPEDPKEFTEQGIELKPANDKIPGAHIKITTKYLDKPLNVQDAKKNKLPHDFIIGNGSVVNVRWSPYSYDKGVSATLNGIQVLEYVEYEAEGPFEEEEDGFDFSAVGSNASPADDDAGTNTGL